MRVVDFLRYILIVVSFGLFSFQMHNSIIKLIEQVPVDSTSYISLSDLDAKPLVTVCSNELDTYLNDLGDSMITFLSGENQY